jgi:hypothetical protein
MLKTPVNPRYNPLVVSMQILYFICLSGILVFGVADSAHAYLDAGTGSMLLQALLAGIAGAGVVIKIYWRRLMLFFSRSKSNKE